MVMGQRKWRVPVVAPIVFPLPPRTEEGVALALLGFDIELTGVRIDDDPADRHDYFPPFV